MVTYPLLVPVANGIVVSAIFAFGIPAPGVAVGEISTRNRILSVVCESTVI